MRRLSILFAFLLLFVLGAPVFADELTDDYFDIAQNRINKLRELNW